MSLKKNILANYFGQSWSTLINFLLIPFYIKYLGMEAYGLIGAFASIQLWLALLDMGIWPTVSREMARFTSGQYNAVDIHKVLFTTEVIYFCIAAVVAIALLAISPFIASDWFNAEQLQPVVVIQCVKILALTIVFRWWSNLYRGSIQGLQRQVWLNLFTGLVATLRGFGALALVALFHKDVTAFFLWQLALTIVELVGLRIKLFVVLPSAKGAIKFSTDSLKHIWRFAGGLFLTNFLSATMTQSDKLILSTILTLENFGYYTLATSLGQVLQLFAQPIRIAIYPQIVKQAMQADDRSLIDTFHIGTQAMSLAVIPAGMIMIFFSQLAIFVWSGDSILASKTSLIASMVTAGFLMNCLVMLPSSVPLAYGWTSLGVWTNLIACALIVPATILGAQKFGTTGAAAAWVGLNTGYLFISIHFIHQRYLKHEKWKWYNRAILIPLTVATLICVTLDFFRPENWGRVATGTWLISAWLLVSALLIFSMPAMRARIIKNLRNIGVLS